MSSLILQRVTNSLYAAFVAGLAGVQGSSGSLNSGETSYITLSDYWETPNNKALFLGSYDCGYRIYRCTFESLETE